MVDPDFKALEAFVVDNADLENLEALVGKFNIFEAIGATRRELRHSDFLAYLLNPQESHGLGGVFAKLLLQKAIPLASSDSPPINAIDLDVWDLEAMQVLREWQNIDILLRDEKNKLAVAIENKIDTGEHSKQLLRYQQTLSQNFPDWNVMGLYLTPDGSTPSGSFFIPLDYGKVASLISKLAKNRESALEPDVRTLMTHYIEILRRHIVEESDIVKLCQKIYRKHMRAIDLIVEHRPDLQAEIRQILEDLVKQQKETLVLDDCNKASIRFVPKHWDDLNLKVSQRWTSTNRILLFEFQNKKDSLRLKLMIGPGDGQVREALFQMARRHGPPLHTARSLTPMWNGIYNHEFISPDAYDRLADDDRRAEIEKHWNRFLASDYAHINNLVVNEPGVQRH
ncbi:MAG: PD-(D/E)XK nuclease family protein [Terriglobia bacterium]|jgi:hypothetical protein